MAGGIDPDVGGKLAVVPDSDHACVDDRAVIVGKKILSNLDAVPVIAVKRRVDEGIFRFSQKFLHNRFDPVKI